MKLPQSLFVFLLVLSTVFTMPARSQDATATPSSGDIPSLIQEAKDRLNRGDPNGALQIYEAALKKDPNNIVALYFAGNLSLQLKQIVQGLTLLTRAATLSPADPQLWLLLGKAYEQFATPEDAMRAYKHIQETSPKSPQVQEAGKRLRLLSGKKMLSLGSTKQAQEIFSNLLNDFPKDAELLTEIKALNQDFEQTRDKAAASASDIPSLIQEAKDRLNRGDTTGAMQIYEAILKKDPDNVVALYFAGNLSLQLKQIVPGLTFLTRAATLSPTDPKLWSLLGKAYEQFATPEDAMRVYKHIQEIAPGSPQAQESDKRLRLLSGKKLLTLGSTKQAQEIFSNLLNDYPKDPSVLTEIKAINQASEQTRANVAGELTPEKLEEAAKLSSSDIPTLLAEGKNRVAQNDPKGALQIYEAVLTKDGNNIEALFFAGNLYLAVNQPEQGLKYLERAVSILPNNIRLRMALAQSYEKNKSIEQAQHEYQAINELSPNTTEGREANKRFQLMSSKIALSQSRIDQALEILKRLNDEHPNDSEVLSEIETVNRAKNLTRGPVDREAPIVSGPAPSSDIALLLKEGRDLLTKNDLKEALDVYDSVLAKDANNFEALYFGGNLYLQLNNPQQGFKYLKRSLALAPNNLRLRLFLAQNFEKYNLLGDALREYGDIIGLSVTSPEGQEANKRFQLLTGLRALYQGNPDQSLEVFNGLFREYPEDAAALSDVVNSYIITKRMDYAQKFLEGIVTKNPGNSTARFYLAGVYERLGNIQQAINHYEIILKQISPKAPGANAATLRIAMMKGALAIQSSAFPEAKQYFEQALSLDPKSLVAQLNLAIVYRGLGDNSRAEEILHDILKNNPDYLEARIKLGVLYVQTGRLEDAAFEFEETRIRGWGSPIANNANQALSSIYALAKGSEIRTKVEDSLVSRIKEPLAKNLDDYDSWTKLALMYVIFGKKNEAQDAYENIVRLKPQNTQALESLAGLYDDNNDLAKAESTYIRARDSAQDPAAKRLIEKKLTMVSAKKAYEEKKMDIAEAKFKEVIANNPQDYVGYFYLGIVHSLGEKYEDAAHDYEEVVKIVPAHGAARFRLGILYEQLKRDEDALTQYRAMLRLTLDKGLEESARRQVETVERRIQGFDFSITYTENYTDNQNLTQRNPIAEIHSDLGGTFSFHHKLYLKPISLGLSFSPSYVTYHNAQTDTLGGSITPFVTYNWRDFDFSTNLTYSVSNNFTLNTPISSSYNIGSDVSRSIRLPALFPWLAAADDRNKAPTTWRVNIGANDYKASNASISDSRSYTFGFSLNQSSSSGWRWSGGYTFLKTSPDYSIGSDLANNSHGLSAQLSKFISPRMSAFGGYSYTRQFYTNPDSFSLFTKKRKSGNHSVNMGLNYFLSPNLRMFCQAAYLLNRSSLPTGFILSPENLGIVIGAQNTSLGYYTNITASAGVAFSF